MGYAGESCSLKKDIFYRIVNMKKNKDLRKGFCLINIKACSSVKAIFFLYF